MLVCSEWLEVLAEDIADELRQLNQIHQKGFRPKVVSARLRNDPRFVEAAVFAENNSSSKEVRTRAARRAVPREERERAREDQFQKWVEYSLQRFKQSEHEVAVHSYNALAARVWQYPTCALCMNS